MDIKYKANPDKIVEAINYILHKAGNVARIFVLKSLYFADKFHLQQFGRPVTGDTYYKLRHGPVGTIAYDILKRERDRIAPKILEKAAYAFAEIQGDDHHYYYSRKPPRCDAFSRSDLQCLDQAISHCIQLSQSDKNFYGDYNLSEASHKERAWLEAELKAELDYEKIIDEDIPDRNELVAYIRETCCTIHC